MKTKKILYPGQAGTQKWMKTYGDKLLAVRYKYDEKNKRKMITVELLADEQVWQKDEHRIPVNKIVKVRINYGELDLGIRVKSLGGKWNRKEGVWECKYEIVKVLGLTDRIVEKVNKLS